MMKVDLYIMVQGLNVYLFIGNESAPSDPDQYEMT